MNSADENERIQEMSRPERDSDTHAIRSLVPTRTRRRIIQNYMLVWLDTSIDESQEEFRKSLANLQCIFNTIDIFIDVDQCIEFLKQSCDEKIFLIVSDVLSQTFVPLVHDLPQLDSIFIFFENKMSHEYMINKWSKVRDTSSQIDLICKSLRYATNLVDQNSVSVSIISGNAASSNQNLIQIDPTFLYTQLLKEILLEINFDESHSIPEFIEFSRSRCIGNSTELNKIEQFEHGYHDHAPIWWYTFECSFLYRALNRALGHLELDTLLKMGFFIHDLHQHIVQLHNEQQQLSDSHTASSFLVYRGQGLSTEDFDKLKNSEGGLISFNNFLSTSLEQQVALEFIERVRAKAEKIPVLFVMTVDPKTTMSTTSPFALIDQVSCFENEREILFSMNSVFRIDETKEMDGINRGLWQVKLTLTGSDSDPQFAALINCLRAENTGSTGWTRLGELLIKLSKYDKAAELYKALIETTTDEKWNAHYYYMLGLVEFARGAYAESISLYEKALEIFLKDLTPNDTNLASAYNNIGLVYATISDYPKALTFYKKALEKKQKILPLNHPNLTSTYNNIGLVYYNLCDYTKALSFYEISVEIQKIALPSYHPDLAKSYRCIAMAYHKLGHFTKSLEYYDKTIDIQKKSLPPNHPEIATSLNTTGEVYRDMGDYLKALSCYKQALEMKEKSLSSSDPELVSSYASMGDVNLKMGDYSTALSCYEKAMEIQEKYFPSNHPVFAAACMNMGNVNCCMGNYSIAISFYEKSIEIHKKILTPNQHDLVSCYYNIGILYHNMGNYAAALSFLKPCLEMQDTLLVKEQLTYAFVYHGLGRVYQSMNDYTTSMVFYQKALAIRESMLSSKHPDLATAYNSIGDIHRLSGQYELALSFHRKALDIQQNAVCNELETATTCNSLAETLREMQDYTSALVYYEMTLKIREKLLPKLHVDLAVVHHSLAQIYYANKQYCSAMEHVKLALEIVQQSLPENHPYMLSYTETLQKVQKAL
ncbi:unnamed protein product [Rotaria socialis]